MCDDHDLTVVLPAPAATFYQTMTAKLTIKYTWTSTVPTDLDIFAISPGGADHGPGSPDDTSTGPSEEDLTVTDPVDGVWHIRSVASPGTGAHNRSRAANSDDRAATHDTPTASPDTWGTHLRELSRSSGLFWNAAAPQLHQALVGVIHCRGAWRG